MSKETVRNDRKQQKINEIIVSRRSRQQSAKSGAATTMLKPSPTMHCACENLKKTAYTSMKWSKRRRKEELMSTKQEETTPKRLNYDEDKTPRRHQKY